MFSPFEQYSPLSCHYQIHHKTTSFQETSYPSTTLVLSNTTLIPSMFSIWDPPACNISSSSSSPPCLTAHHNRLGLTQLFKREAGRCCGLELIDLFRPTDMSISHSTQWDRNYCSPPRLYLLSAHKKSYLIM